VRKRDQDSSCQVAKNGVERIAEAASVEGQRYRRLQLLKTQGQFRSTSSILDRGR